MYSNILIVHRVVVTIFLLHYVIKAALLLLDKKEQLASYTKLTRIAEMVISLLFLITGGWMLVNAGSIGKFMIIKLVFVFASIPLAIVGFKKGNKALAALAILLIVGAYGLAEMSKKEKAGGKVDTSTVHDPIEAGKLVYSSSCINCHGADGKLGLSGAKDLSKTTLSIDDQKAIIKNGKNAMPGNSNLTDEQMMDLIEYIGTLKQ